jgi:hypothetical protein
MNDDYRFPIVDSVDGVATLTVRSRPPADGGVGAIQICVIPGSGGGVGTLEGRVPRGASFHPITKPDGITPVDDIDLSAEYVRILTGNYEEVRLTSSLGASSTFQIVQSV